MSSSDILKSVSALMISITLMMIGYGMFSTFISLRMEIEGFSRQLIGYQTSAFYIGLVIGSLLCAKLINRVGHIRAFAAFCAASATCLLVFPFLKFISSWIILRAILGFCLAGQYMCVESWLSARSTSQTRGTVLAVYMMASNFAFGAGQLMLNIAPPTGMEYFMFCAALYALALIPVSLTKSSHPDPVEASYFGIGKLFTISPVAVTGCFTNGLILGAIIGLTPLFIKDLGFPISTITIFMTLYMVSGMIMQFPVGKLSDSIDRRYVIVGASSVLLLACIPFMIVDQPSINFIYILAIILGGASQPLYPLCISYANDYLTPEQLVKASGGLVLAYGLGAAIGPSIAAFLMAYFGSKGLFYFIAGCVTFYILFVIYRSSIREAPSKNKEAFIAMPDPIITPVGYDFDPRYTNETGADADDMQASETK